MEKRAFIAVVLSTLVFLVFQSYMGRMYPNSKQKGKSANNEKPSHNEEKSMPTQKKAPVPPVEETSIPILPPPTKVVIEVKEITINTGLTEITLTNKGGKIKGISLREYTGLQGEGVALVRDYALGKETKGSGETKEEAIFDALRKMGASRDDVEIGAVKENSFSFLKKIIGTPLRKLSGYQIDDKITVLAYRKEDWNGRLPVSLYYGDEKISQRINTSTFLIPDETEGRIVLSETSPEKKLRFVYEDVTGVRIIKEYTLHYNDYKIGVEITIEDNNNVFKDSTVRFTWGTPIGGEEKSSVNKSGPISLLVGNKLISKTPDVGEETLYEHGVKWAALQDKYFMVALIPDSTEGIKGVVKRIGEKENEVGFLYDIKNSVMRRFDIYAGPKQEDILKISGSSLDNIIDYGWFDFVAKPLFSILKIFYSYTHNYGVAIIIITIIIKMIFFPLSQKSFVSMKRMQKIQPHMKLLQERYKDDKTKLNAEMMNLYKEHKVNPLGGCLPNLVQIPVFFGLYRVLLSAIELRHAPFILWITDLAAKDPYYITPILMGVTMFLQQKMSPSTGDSTQAKVMVFMPVIFTVLFLNFPSGLVLYWLVNNMLTIGQQYMVQKSIAN